MTATTPDRTVLFIEQEIPHYRAGVLAAIAQGVEADFHFFHGETNEGQAFIAAATGELPQRTSHIFVRWILREKLVLQNYWSALRHRGKGRNLVVVRHNPRSLLLLPFMWWCRLRGWPVIVWGQGYSRKRAFRPRRHPLDLLNLAIVSTARAFVAYSDEIREHLGAHVNPRKLFTACNTLNLSGLTTIRRQLELETKARVRARIGLHSQYYLVFIGRLQARKQAHLFIRTLACLQQEHGLNVGGIIIGKGPEESNLRKQAADTAVRDVHFTGALPFESSAEFLFAADVLLIPGWLGLAVNHAFFFGVPVVSQRSDETLRNHAPEAAYIRDGENGYLSDASQPESLVAAVKAALASHQTLGANARAYFDLHLDVSRMVEGFRQAIDFALPPTPRATVPSPGGAGVHGHRREAGLTRAPSG